MSDSIKNSTDYNFPPGWGLYTDMQKCTWYEEERAYRQAMRQDTAWGRAAREFHADNEFKHDDDETFR